MVNKGDDLRGLIKTNKNFFTGASASTMKSYTMVNHSKSMVNSFALLQLSLKHLVPAMTLVGDI